MGLHGIASFDVYISFDITNLTTKTLEGVTSQLPYFCQIAEFHRDGSESNELVEFSNQIELGEFRPEEDITVTAWFDNYPFSYIGKDVKVFTVMTSAESRNENDLCQNRISARFRFGS